MRSLTILTLSAIAVASLTISCAKGGGSGESPSAATQAAIQKGDVVKAVLAGNIDQVVRLKSAGADLNENVGDTENAVTPLMAAIVSRKNMIALYLLDEGVSTQPTFYGYSAYAFALGILGDEDPLSKNLRFKN